MEEIDTLYLFPPLRNHFAHPGAKERSAHILLPVLQDLGRRPTYDVEDLSAPRLNEFTYGMLMKALQVWPINKLILWKIKLDAGFSIVEKLAAHINSVPLHLPTTLPSRAEIEAAGKATASFNLESFIIGSNDDVKSLSSGGHFRRWSVKDYVTGYKSGKFTPVDVAKAIIEAVRKSDEAQPPLRSVIQMNETTIMLEAQQAEARIKIGATLSPLDGVPVLFKEEIDVFGYRSTFGTDGRVVGVKPCEADAPLAARLRSMGLLFIGKANMHEFGGLPLGLNAHWGDVRNPYNPAHITGGSSSGSAAATAAGLVPFAVGTDGGGSIRIPSALSGVVGLKPTHGRVPHPYPYTSVTSAGPLAGTVKDVAALYMALAGKHNADVSGYHQPEPHLDGFENIEDLTDVRIGVYWPYFKDATADIVAANERALEALKAKGATVVNVTLPELQATDKAHKVCIMTEFATGMQSFWKNYENEIPGDARLSIILGRSFSGKEYLAAQKLRRHLVERWTELFEDVDVIVTPSTGITAPLLEGRIADMKIVSQLMRFVSAANYLGNPGLTVPVGYTNDTNLPIGMQFMARHWAEHKLLRIGHAVEAALQQQGIIPKKPAVFFDLLSNLK